MKIDVKFGSKVISVTLGDDATLHDLRQHLFTQTQVPPALQKLTGKLVGKDDTKPLASLGFKDGTKLMLIGSSAQEVVAAVSEPKEAASSRAKRLKSLPADFWQLPPFGGMMCDPYVDGKGGPVEGGTAPLTLLVLDVILSRINKISAASSTGGGSSGSSLFALSHSDVANAVCHPLLANHLSQEEKQCVARAHAVIRRCSEFTLEAAKAASEPKAALEVVNMTIQAIQALAPGDYLMLPAGWIGMTQHTTAFLLVTKLPLARGSGGTETYSLTVINRSRSGGSLYHPQLPTGDKIKVLAEMTLEPIARDKMLDEAFWLVLLSQWVRGLDPQTQSEFCRCEVMYDVLLPWLVEPSSAAALGPQSVAELVQHKHQLQVDEKKTVAPSTDVFSTFARSESSAMKSAVSGFTFLLRKLGIMDTSTIKRIKMCLRYEFVVRAVEDLVLAAKRFLPPPTPTASVGKSAMVAKKGTVSPPPAVKAEEQSSGPLPSLASAVSAVSARINKSTPTPSSSSSAAPSEGHSLKSLLWDHFTVKDFVKTKTNVIIPADQLENKYVVVYFSGSWCPPCKKLTPLLIELYESLQKAKIKQSTTTELLPPFEFIFASCDKSQEECNSYGQLFPFPRLTYPCDHLYETCEVTSVPQIFIFGPDGTLLTRQGVRALRQDPEGREFPRGIWSGAVPMTDTDVAILRTGLGQLAYHALKRHDAAVPLVDDAFLNDVHELTTSVSNLIDAFPKHATFEGGRSAPHDAFERHDAEESALSHHYCDDSILGRGIMEGSIDLSCAESSFPNAGLLKLENTSRYCGQGFSPIAPATLDPSKLRRPETMADVERQLGVLTAMVDTLWERARSGGTSSRVAIQMQIIELITHAFSTVFPVPRPSSATANNGSAASSSSTSASILNVGVASGLTPAEEQASSLVYSQPLPDVPTASAAGGQQQAQPDPQVTMCKMIHKLFLSYGTAWQSVETPSRGFDSERGLIAMTMLSIYDAIARNSQNSKQGWLLAHLLSDDGGYFLSTTVCKGNRPFADIASMMELTQPQLLPVLA